MILQAKRLKKYTLFLLIFLLILGLSSCELQQVSIEDEGAITTEDEGNSSGGNSSGGESGDSSPDTPYTYSYNESVKINSYHNNIKITLAGNVYIPNAKVEGELFPAIIFINSWACEEHEYIMQALKFAKKGYIVLSYACRGWGLSEGLISMGGEADRTDFVSVVDWLRDNTPVDMDNVGTSGISLGGGGSLLGASVDSRIKTCAVMSSYINAYESMFGNETPRLVWGGLLLASSFPFGNLDQWCKDLYMATLFNSDPEFIKEISLARSPIMLIDKINAANIPIYMSQNMGDYMFHADLAIDYYNKLTVDHKYLDLNQGTHASSEGFGLIGMSNYVFGNVEKWFDYWLKGIETDLITSKERTAVMTMEVKGSKDRLTFPEAELIKEIDGKTCYQWPANSLQTKTLYASPRTETENGKLSESANTSNTSNQINSSPNSGASCGIPMLTPTLEDFEILFKVDTADIKPEKAMIYETAPFENGINIRGNLEFNTRLSLSGVKIDKVPVGKGQVVFYLYDVNESGEGYFITHAFQSFWDETPDAVIDLPVSFLINAYNLEAGHRLMVVMDTSDIAYGPPTIQDYDVSIHFSDKADEQSVLTIPYL
ncbi:MAG: hypothetical protein GY754_46965 [bacterium]|nr:hypothetical protein [bacterium]